MEIDEFVRESMLQIFKGLREAQKAINDQGPGAGVVNPKWGEDKDFADYTSKVEFDIAVSASSQKSGSGSAKLQVLSLEVGGGGEAKFEKGSVSRVAFSVTVAFPAVTVTDVPSRRSGP